MAIHPSEGSKTTLIFHHNNNKSSLLRKKSKGQVKIKSPLPQIRILLIIVQEILDFCNACNQFLKEVLHLTSKYKLKIPGVGVLSTSKE